MTPAKQRVIRQAAALLCASLVLLPGLTSAQVAVRCTQEVADYLADFPLSEGEVKDVRLIERTNIADDFGPDIFGVDAWVRLNSCSGFLVLNLNKNCFLRQSYTRGDCQVEGLSKY